jgi:adenosylhomocysteine nucleosidase
MHPMAGTVTTLVCFAVKEEAAHFRRLAGRRPDLRVLLTGMGRGNAERSLASALADFHPGLVVTSGFAGALIANLARGTVVFSADEETGLEPRLRELGARPVRFHCAERVITTAQEKQALRRATGADAVEMESRYIQLASRERGIPSATVRVILDTADQDLVLDFNQLLTPDQRIDGRKLALTLLRSPFKIPALLSLQKQSAAAAKTLGMVLTQILRT